MNRFYASFPCGLRRPLFKDIKPPPPENLLYTYKRIKEKSKRVALAKLIDTPLQSKFIKLCASNSIPSVMSFLKDDTFDPSFNENKALRFACFKGLTEVVKLLIKHPKVNPSVDNDCPIVIASGNGHLEIVKMLLDVEGVNPAANRNSALIMASRNGFANVVRLLLDHFKVDPTDVSNMALRAACAAGKVETVKVLLDDPRVDPSSLNNEALYVCCKRGYDTIFRMLLKDRRTRITAKDYFTFTDSFHPKIRASTAMIMSPNNSTNSK